MTEQQVINTYAASGRSYQDIRHVLTRAGYHTQYEAQYKTLRKVGINGGYRYEQFYLI